MADKRRTLKVMPTEYMLGVLIRERQKQEMCDHKEFYEDSDGVYRCDYCNKPVDPDEVEWAQEVLPFSEDPDNE